MTTESVVALRYLRPLKLSLLFSVGGEAALLVVFGLILFPEGNLLHKVAWTIGFCRVGMGDALGALLGVSLVDRIDGWRAVLACVALSVTLIGFACDYLCLSLNRHFGYFGGAEHPGIFLWVSVVLSALGGQIVGWFCFTETGRTRLARLGW